MASRDDKPSKFFENLFGNETLQTDRLIEYLHLIQDKQGFIEAGQMQHLAARLNLSEVEVFEVASFYHHFYPLAKDASAPQTLVLRVCQSVSCKIQNGSNLLRSLSAALGDKVRVEAAPCVGRCAQAPVVVVGTNPIENAQLETVRDAIDSNQISATAVVDHIGFDVYRAAGGYGHWERALKDELSKDWVVKTLERSGLRGMGGAGFPTARKWKSLCDQSGEKFLVVNIDEGEPGTFKDRFCLETSPHRMLEGALLASWVIDARSIYIYLRDEYAGIRRMLEQEIEFLRAEFGDALPSFDLRRGAGAYICGEETALLESLEGKRGMPRQKPPMPFEAGLFGRPTLIQNCETLYWIPEILAESSKGQDWTPRRIYSVSGRVRKPGAYSAPLGTSARELIDNYAEGMLSGHQLSAFFPGGVSSGLLPAELADTPLDFESLAALDSFAGSGALIVLSNQDNLGEIARDVMVFFADESCGQCTPCRVGASLSKKLMADRPWNVDHLDDLAFVMEQGSICGLGQAAPNVIRSVLRYFPEQVS